MSDKPQTWTVRTAFEGQIITQSVIDDRTGETLLEHVMNLRERGLRKALMDLGWRPPADAVTPNRRILSSRPIEGEPQYRLYTLSCGHEVMRRVKSDKLYAQCGECALFPGIIS